MQDQETNAGLVIGVTGRLCCGKQEFAQLVKAQRPDKPIELVNIYETFAMKTFFNRLIEQMQEENIKGDIFNLNPTESERLDKMILEIYNDCIDEAKGIELLKSVLNNWKVNQIVFPIRNKIQIDLMKNRNYFHLIQIETPTLVRYQNFCNKYETFKEKIPLEFFCLIDDLIAYKPGIEQDCFNRSNIIIDNPGNSQQFLQNYKLKEDDIFRPIRPDWDIYFMHVAQIVKTRSNCMKRAVGAVLVKGNRIVSTGYNGSTIGKLNCYEGGCERCNMNTKQGEDLEKCFCFHAEENAILECGTHKSQGATLYTTLFPCYQCSKIILAAKIAKLCYEEDYAKYSETSELEQHMKVQQVSTKHYVFGG